jgi:serine O-acetyltransferase
MDSAFAKNPAELRSVDPVWDRIREAAHAAAAAEPVLAGTLHATILSQPRFESALSYHLARLVGTTEVPAALIRQTFDEALAADPGIGLAARADIMAVVDRDPACNSHLDPLLWFKGYHALQTYRASHWLWTEGRRTLAHFLQSRSSSLFGLDIHPGAVIGKSIFIDHGTGVVIGETASIGHRCRIYQGVTLGAKSFEREADGSMRRGYKRHPTLEDDVVVYAGATILGGDTVIGKGSVVAGGVFLTKSVPPGNVVTGPKVELRMISMGGAI